MADHNPKLEPGFKYNSDGQINFDNFLSTLESYQSDGIDYLYDIEPQSNNLFWAGYFNEASNGNLQEKAFYNSAYRIRKISIPMPKLEIEEQLETKAPIFKNATFPQKLTIEWFEDVYHSVQKYHLDWFARWYNRKYDVLRCGIAGKFRKMIVVAFHYINSGATTIIETPKVQPIFAFRIGGMVPTDLPDMVFDHSGDGNDQVLSMEYRCSVIEWLYSDKLGMGRTADIWGDPSTVKDPNFKKMASWEPTNFVQDSIAAESQNALSLEKLRATRAMTSFQVSEGSLG